MKKPTASSLAKPALLAATVIWGSSFIIVKDVTDNLPTFSLLAIRFLCAAVILAIIFRKRILRATVGTMWRGAVLGTLLFTAYTLQTIGITDTTPGKNAFLTAVYCVMVPFMAWLFNKKRPDRYNVLAAAVCIIGIGMVSLNADFTMRTGDFLTLCGGVFYALHIIAVSKFSDGDDPVALTVFQFAASGILAGGAALIFDRNAFPGVVWNTELILSITYLTVLCTAVALLFQNFGQKYTDPSSASLLLSLESVFGVAFSAALGREEMTIKLILGFMLIFAAIVISETKLSFLHRFPKA